MRLVPLFAAGLACLSLASCGTSGTASTDVKTFTGSGFSMSVPSAWTAVSSKSLPKANQGTLALAMSSTEISGGFANNLTVLADDLQKATTSREYAVTNNTLSSAAYTEYAKTSETAIEFSDKDTSLLYQFEARYNTTTPRGKFFQTAKVCGKKVYVITIGVSVSTEGSSRYTDLAKSFKCE